MALVRLAWPAAQSPWQPTTLFARRRNPVSRADRLAPHAGHARRDTAVCITKRQPLLSFHHKTSIDIPSIMLFAYQEYLPTAWC
jgi:hypothetical protein